jgi:hypothetical protein
MNKKTNSRLYPLSKDKGLYALFRKCLKKRKKTKTLKKEKPQMAPVRKRIGKFFFKLWL